MSDLLAGLGIALVLEGVLWALFPRLAVSFLMTAARTPELTLRLAGLTAAGTGIAFVWLVRG